MIQRRIEMKPSIGTEDETIEILKEFAKWDDASMETHRSIYNSENQLIAVTVFGIDAYGEPWKNSIIAGEYWDVRDKFLVY
jgi:hypothetical protein